MTSPNRGFEMVHSQDWCYLNWQRTIDNNCEKAVEERLKSLVTSCDDFVENLQVRAFRLQTCEMQSEAWNFLLLDYHRSSPR